LDQLLCKVGAVGSELISSNASKHNQGLHTHKTQHMIEYNTRWADLGQSGQQQGQQPQ
jgi:hypothetical protein